MFSITITHLIDQLIEIGVRNECFWQLVKRKVKTNQ